MELVEILRFTGAPLEVQTAGGRNFSESDSRRFSFPFTDPVVFLRALPWEETVVVGAVVDVVDGDDDDCNSCCCCR